MFEQVATRALLDQLLADSRLYTSGEDYKDLLQFVVRLRNFAPFNAMLIHIQKPGLSYAASAQDWEHRFGRRPTAAARPLLILRPFGPVALVYDVLDTEGDPLPEDVATFSAVGGIGLAQMASFVPLLAKKRMDIQLVDQGDNRAGSIRAIRASDEPSDTPWYEMQINRNHDANVQFATLAHELAHLFLGHLGPDSALKVPLRARPNHDQRELEAESVAYVVCSRNGVRPNSDRYLSSYVTQGTTVEDIEIYQVLRAAGQIETLLKLTAHTQYDQPQRKAPDGGREVRTVRLPSCGRLFASTGPSNLKLHAMES